MQVITRVVWSVCWTPDSLRFLTASRDKRLVAWGQLQHGGKWEQVGLHSSFFSLTYLEVEQYIQRDIGDIVVVTIPTNSVHCQVCPPLLLPDSVTAVAVSPALLSPGSYLVAAGLDSGAVHLVTWTPGVLI